MPADIEPGVLVTYKDEPLWGIGLVICEGPVMPVSGKQFVVLWPEAERNGSRLASTLDYFPALYLEVVKNRMPVDV